MLKCVVGWTKMVCFIYILTEIVCKPFSKCSLKTYICEFDEICILSFEPENRDVLQHNGWIDH